jgi:phage host-nuclease inhibitor protein Gam
MVAVRAPRSVNAATKLLERFAELDGEIAKVEEARRAELAQVNAEADAMIAPFLPERDAIVARLQAWWLEAGPALTGGKRKSMTLGGCEIGSRKSRAMLGIAGDVAKVTERLAKQPWANEMVITTISIDRAAVLKSIDGAHAKDLAKLGFSRVEGSETVFVKRVQQGGTIGATS